MKKLLIYLIVFFNLTVLQVGAVVPTEPSTESVFDTKTALYEFKSLSRKDRKARIKEAKGQLRKYKANKRAGKATEQDTVLLAILAILLPPLAVYLHQESTNSKFWLSVILSLLFWLPGIIYALLVIFGNA